MFFYQKFASDDHMTGYWILTSPSQPSLHLQGVVSPIADLWHLQSRAYEEAQAAAIASAISIPKDAVLEVQKYNPPDGWRT